MKRAQSMDALGGRQVFSCLCTPALPPSPAVRPSPAIRPEETSQWWPPGVDETRKSALLFGFTFRAACRAFDSSFSLVNSRVAHVSRSGLHSLSAAQQAFLWGQSAQFSRKCAAHSLSGGIFDPARTMAASPENDFPDGSRMHRRDARRARGTFLARHNDSPLIVRAGQSRERVLRGGRELEVAKTRRGASLPPR